MVEGSCAGAILIFGKYVFSINQPKEGMFAW